MSSFFANIVFVLLLVATSRSASDFTVNSTKTRLFYDAMESRNVDDATEIFLSLLKLDKDLAYQIFPELASNLPENQIRKLVAALYGTEGLGDFFNDLQWAESDDFSSLKKTVKNMVASDELHNQKYELYLDCVKTGRAHGVEFSKLVLWLIDHHVSVDFFHCGHCNGSGIEMVRVEKDCPHCEGGYLPCWHNGKTIDYCKLCRRSIQTKRKFFGGGEVLPGKRVCSNCNGNGKLLLQPESVVCSYCNGKCVFHK